MSDAGSNDERAEADGDDADVEVADVSGGAVPEQMLEDSEPDVNDSD